MKIRILFALGLGSAAALSGCGDDPFSFPWEPSPDTLRLYALSQPDLNRVSALDAYPRRAVRVEAAATAGQWDVAVDTADGRFVWLPPGVLGVASQAGIAELDERSFDAARTAPADTARYARDRAVPVEPGRVYALRTRRHAGSFGATCRYYGKVQALDIDVPGAAILLHYDVSPLCNSRSLVPPD